MLTIHFPVILQQKKDVRMLRFIQEVNTTTRSCALWDLEEETDYIVHVQSISMSGTSPLSEPLRFRTPKEAETQASKSKGKVAQKEKTHMHTKILTLAQSSNISTHNLHIFFLCFCPFRDKWVQRGRGLLTITWLILSKNKIKINKHTKREMKFYKSASKARPCWPQPGNETSEEL